MNLSRFGFYFHLNFNAMLVKNVNYNKILKQKYCKFSDLALDFSYFLNQIKYLFSTFVLMISSNIST